MNLHDTQNDLSIALVETLNLVVTPGVVAIEVNLSLGREDISARGVAKRNPADANNPQIGRDLALARALGNLSQKLERRANGLVKHHDDNRLAQEKAKKSPRVRQYATHTV